MRIVFAGTPAFAARVLERIVEAQHEVALVLTRPDRPAGRGLKLLPGAVKGLSAARALQIFQPASLKDGSAVHRIAAARPEAIVTAAYSLILPRQVLDLAPHGALNVHASLLPRWRGAAPIQRALLAGDHESGITIMRMDEGLDTGPVLTQRALAIADEDDAGSLHDKLAALGADLMVEVLAALAAGKTHAVPQPAAGASYARKIDNDEAVLDWSMTARQLERVVRALRPVPGAQTGLRGERCKIWHARVVQGRGEPGTVLAAGPAGIRIACGEEALEIIELQRAGGRRLHADEFLRGFAVAAGERLAFPR